MSIAAVTLGTFLTLAGISHFIVPNYYRTLVPSWMPASTQVITLSGIADGLAGLLLLVPATREIGGWTAAGLLTVYMVSHLDAALTADPNSRRWLDRPTGTATRILVNLGYIGWAATVPLSS